jgi:hypothetical protein
MPKSAGSWKPGESGNPAGRQTGARNRLNDKFITELAADFEEHGIAAIVKVREENVVAYLQLCARFQPQEIHADVGVSDQLGELLRKDPAELARRMALVLLDGEDAGQAAANFPEIQGEA